MDTPYSATPNYGEAMIEATKEKAKHIAKRLRLAIEVAAIVLILTIWAGTKGGYIHGDFEISPVTFGGGTAKEAEAEQTTSQYATKLPDKAIKDGLRAIAEANPPRPSDKPPVPPTPAQVVVR
jgi:hypothetical protein